MMKQISLADIRITQVSLNPGEDGMNLRFSEFAMFLLVLLCFRDIWSQAD